MKLDKFQQYVKDENLDCDLTETASKQLIVDIEWVIESTHEELFSEIAGRLEMIDLVDYVVECNSIKAHDKICKMIKCVVNEKISETLEEIEDIEAVNAIEAHQDEEDMRGDYLYEEKRQREIDEEL